MTSDQVVMAILDGLERVSTPQEYYRINHAPRHTINALAAVVILWCAEVGIQVEQGTEQGTVERRGGPEH